MKQIVHPAFVLLFIRKCASVYECPSRRGRWRHSVLLKVSLFNITYSLFGLDKSASRDCEPSAFARSGSRQKRRGSKRGKYDCHDSGTWKREGLTGEARHEVRGSFRPGLRCFEDVKGRIFSWELPGISGKQTFCQI